MGGPAREFTWIAALALVLVGVSCATPSSGRVPAPTALERSGEQALAEGRAAEARGLFFQAMRGQQCPFVAWIGVARSSLALGDMKTTDVAISQAMQTNPGTAGALDLVGRTLLMQAQQLGEGGRSQALMADALFDRAERMDPSTRKIAYHRGLAHLAANDAAGASVLLERAMAADGAEGDTVQALLLAYERSGQTARAKSLRDSVAKPEERLDAGPSRP